MELWQQLEMKNVKTYMIVIMLSKLRLLLPKGMKYAHMVKTQHKYLLTGTTTFSSMRGKWWMKIPVLLPPILTIVWLEMELWQQLERKSVKTYVIVIWLTKVRLLWPKGMKHPYIAKPQHRYLLTGTTTVISRINQRRERRFTSTKGKLQMMLECQYARGIRR